MWTPIGQARPCPEDDLHNPGSYVIDIGTGFRKFCTMISLLALLAALQAPSFAALDEAHESWMRCVIPAAERLAGRPGEEDAIVEAAYRACEREEVALRAIHRALDPRSTPADVDDIIAQDKRRSSFMVRAAIANARGH